MGLLGKGLKKPIAAVGALALTAAALLPAAAPPAASAAEARESVYDDALNALYANYSWAQVDLAYAGDKRGGGTSIRMEPDDGRAMYLYRDRILTASDFETFEMYVKGEGLGGQQAKLVFQTGGVPQSEWMLHELVEGGIPADELVRIAIPADEVSPGNAWVDTIILSDVTGGDQPALLIDDIAFVGAGTGEQPGGEEPGGEEPGGEEPGGEEPGGEEPGENGPGGAPEVVSGISIYQEALGAGFQDFGWADHSLDYAGAYHTGERSIRMEPDNGGAVYLYSGVPIAGKSFESFEFWIRGGSAGGQQLKVSFLSGGRPIAEVPLSTLLPEGVAAGEWRLASASLASLGLLDQVFDAFVIADASGGDQPVVYLDDIVLRAKEVIPAALVETRLDKHQVVLLAGESQPLEMTAFYADGTDKVVSEQAAWVSDAPSIVSVEGGRVVGVSEGVAKITGTLGAQSASAYVQVADIEEAPLYRDGLEPGASNWSWHEKNLLSEAEAHSGRYSIEFLPGGWDGVWLNGDQERKFGETYGVRFWIHGGATGGQRILVHLYEAQGYVGTAELNDHLPNGALAPGEWHEVTLNAADFGVTDGAFTGIVFQAGTEQNQPVVYIDDVSFLRNTSPVLFPQPELPTVSVDIDTASDRKPIDENIYGINYDDMHPTTSTLPFPVERWGGNNTTRYNWKLDATNRASDWYFMNIPYDNSDGTETDQLIDRVDARGDEVLLTLPTIGWTAKDREVSWGFSVEKYGPQRSTAAVDGRPDAGNGELPNGDWMEPINDPHDTSVEIGPDFVVEWIEHLKNNGDKVNFYALDNEPEIWYVTHRDVRPEPTTYDDLWSMTKEYGSAIKAADPDAQIFGPVSWGWCAYFYSSADQCADGPDRQSHGGLPFLEWYLKQLQDYENSDPNGTQLVDYLDIHFYPQEGGIAEDNESSYVQKRRLQSLKSLYHPTFVDNSWIQEPIRLIPRMKEMIAQYNPDMKLAITEYNFGNGDGLTAGLAQAEALAIFGREGVDLATRFGNFKAGTPIEDAFAMYLNYDGLGSKIEGTSVKTSTSNVDAVGAYTIEGTNGEVYVLLFNKDTVARNASLTANIALTGEPEAYRFSLDERLQRVTPQLSTGEDGAAAIALPARSATLLVWK
ncbi:hypothetical protein FE782_30675 [Paenibacillus antri]|uniref:BIG2 domain-containing protein n=1 Tax=Paenibacillus antri TaxID=2582848 RepID=A0A5R9GAI9_9BACL|nr:glycoside hydrolase family 44 protein [Paenibacillus antri]TLS48435.1 hypothetical protein FE782_30675 [Paenibacillus antri]